MNIKCPHCGGNWTAQGIDSPATISAFRNCYPELKAAGVRQLREVLGLSMLETKRLAKHITTKKGKCFHCESSLLLTDHFVKACPSCGAMNLDLYSTSI